PREDMQEADTAVLRSLLSFYDRFARQNATNPKLQGEAAWAYRKVGSLYKRLGRDADSEQTYARAIEMFEDLAARFPDVPEYRYKLAQTYDMADPRTADAETLARLEPRLRRARTLVDQLAVESPDNTDYVDIQAHVLAKLATALERLKH